jgi:hypothetical protein
VITVYALADGLGDRPTATGIDARPVHVLRHRSLTVVTTRHPRAPALSRAAVLAHAGVCEDLMARAEAVLPVRFGESFDDDAALRATLDDRHDRLVHGLAHVRGRVEVGVRVGWDQPRPAATSPSPTDDRTGGVGRRYLMARVDEERRRSAVRSRAEALAREVDDALGRHAADGHLEVLPAEGQLMSAVYLVDRDRVDRMVHQVRAAARRHPELDVLCTGPWPPYSFADVEGIDAGR